MIQLDDFVALEETVAYKTRLLTEEQDEIVVRGNFERSWWREERKGAMQTLGPYPHRANSN